MRILYIHQHFNTRQGAGGIRSYEFAKKLIERGHQVIMVCATTESWLQQQDSNTDFARMEIDGIEVFQSQVPYKISQNIPQRIATFFRFMLFAIRIARTVKDIDLVFATSTPLTVAVPGVVGAWLHKAPFVFEVRDLWPELPKALGVTNPFIIYPMRWLELWAYRNARRVVALAPGIAEGITGTGYPEEKVPMIPNSSDIDIFTPPDTPRQQANSIRLIFTGAHGVANGLDAVLDAARYLQDAGEKDIEFVFIGSGSEREQLKDRAAREKLENVTFLEPVPKLELVKLLQDVDVGMMILKNVPAFYKGTSPNKFFDYIAAGLPVLNNYPGWLASIIEREQCGIAVPPDNPAAFAEAVVYLRDHPEERVAMGRRARELAEREFDRNQMAERFARVLEEVREESL